MPRFVITGTGTDIGKTVFAAGLVGMIRAHYWKPVQSGLADGLDSETVSRLASIGPNKVVPETYRLTEPLSPHRAAELDGVTIDPDRLTLPPGIDPLVIEGAGGVLVPLNRNILFADLFARWKVPVILVARTGLGTISHSLTAVESLRSRDVPIHGIAFVGDANADNERTIAELGGVRQLGRLPVLPRLDPATLAEAFEAAFDARDFS